MTPKTHRRYSPSKLDYLRRCVRFKQVITEGMQDAGNEGVRLHLAYERRSLDGLGDEQKTAVMDAILYADGVKADLQLKYPGEVWLEFNEREMFFRDIYPDDPWGTSDHVIYNERKTIGCILDPKFVHRDELAYGEQLRAYGACLAAEFPTMEIIYTHIVAPRISEFIVNEYDAKELIASVRKETLELIERIENPFTRPTYDDVLCAKCQWAADCPAMGAVARAVTPVALGVQVPVNLDPSAVVSPTERALRRSLADALAEWAERIKESDTAYAVVGGVMPGYKKVTRSTGASIAKENNAAIIEKLIERGYTTDQIMSTVKLSLKQIAEEFCKTTDKNPEVEQDELLVLLADLVKVGETTFFQKSKRSQKPLDIFNELSTGYSLE